MLKFSTYEKAFEELLENEGLKKKAAKSGISYGTLKKVYNRGMAAWRTGHRPGTTPQQWGMARVNSYIGKGKGTYYGAAADLRGAKRKTKKEGFNEAYDKTNRATMHVKDAGVEKEDHPFIRKDVAKTGAKVKFHSGGGISYHGSDHQISKALKQHHPDDHKELGNLNYHKSGQHDKDYGSQGTHVYTNHSAKTKKEATVKEISKSTLDRYIKKADADKSKKHVRADVGKISRDDAYKNQVKRNKGIELAKAKMKPAKVPASEATVKEISKGLAKRYVGKAARDVYFKGRSQATKDAISQLGGPDTDYKKSPERKAAMRMRGIDSATNRLAKKEAMSDAEKAAHQKAIDAFKAKGGKIKKLKPGFAQGYHGKSDPGAGMKGMISPADTKQFGTKKKIGSMK